MKPKLSILKTHDGSFTLKREDLNETYHSLDGAVGESKHVYIENGLAPSAEGKNQVSVFEFGLGTGINAWLAIKFAFRQNIKLDYYAVESFPVPIEIMNDALKRGFQDEDKTLLSQIHSSPWNQKTFIREEISFTKFNCRIEDLDLKKVVGKVDCVFYDAFAPSRQADAWALTNLEKCYNILNEGGILVTYCSQGAFKRHLKSLGFEIISLPGFGNKREITQAIKA